MEVDHLCHRRNCVNLQHLEAKTHAANLEQRSDRIDKPKALTIVDVEAWETGVQRDPVSGAAREIREPNTGRFVKGHAPLAGGGRPKKGESLLDYTRKLVEKAQNKQAVAEAHLDRLLDRGSVGNRAFADHRDTYFGVPKQTLVLQQGADPLAELYAEIAANHAPTYIEGPSE